MYNECAHYIRSGHITVVVYVALAYAVRPAGAMAKTYGHQDSCLNYCFTKGL